MCDHTPHPSDVAAAALAADSAAVLNDEAKKAEHLQLLRGVLQARQAGAAASPGSSTSANSSPADGPLPPPLSLHADVSSGNAGQPKVALSPPRTVPLQGAGSIPPGLALGRATSDAHTHAMLPTRVGHGHVQYKEVEVTSSEAFQRVVLTGTEQLNAEQRQACSSIYHAMELRHKYFSQTGLKKPDYYVGSCVHGDHPFTPAARDTPSRHAAGLHGAHHTASSSHLHTQSNPVGSPAGSDSVDGSQTGLSTAPASPMRSPVGAGGGGAYPAAPGSPTMQRLFYRRRPEPKFSPFSCPVIPRARLSYRMVNGVARIYQVPDAFSQFVSSAGDGAAGPTTAAGLGLDLDGLHTPGGPAQPASAAATAAFRAATPTPRPAGLPLHPTSSAGRTNTPSRASVASADLGARDSLVDGVSESDDPGLYPYPSWDEFAEDFASLLKIVHGPAVKTFAYRRLELLAARFSLHQQLNAERESAEQKAVPHRDFYNVRKVDTHVHHSACFNAKHLLRFIKSKLKKEPDTVVINRDDKDLTLAQVFESLHLTAYDLSIDTLDMHADWTTMHRFDRFNTKYNPVGASRLREIFLKTDNKIGGRYLAEITREIFEDLSASKYQLAEYRLSIYGRSRAEWSRLAAWVVSNKLGCSQVRWMIQIPRLYETYRETGQVSSFGQMIDNIFGPLFEVSIDPSVDPNLHQFLGLIVGIDSVDDESKPEVARDSYMPPPAHWNGPQQPPYHYWTYYIAANIHVLNRLRASRGLTQVSWRPHSGEAGDVEHLAATFLTAEGINHGINLRRSPTLQYLYYLTGIGIAMSPLSNNRLFLSYTKNPFAEFFAKGLNVSLSTDDPLMLTYTKEPLLEEYAVAVQVWKLSSADMCEIARNSVLQSGWEYPWKCHFLGPNYAEPGPEGNDIHFTNVPHIRLQYRLETLRGELELVDYGRRLPTMEKVESASSFPAGQGPVGSTVNHVAGNPVAVPSPGMPSRPRHMVVKGSTPVPHGTTRSAQLGAAADHDGSEVARRVSIHSAMPNGLHTALSAAAAGSGLPLASQPLHS